MSTDWTGKWVKEKVEAHDLVTGVSLVSTHCINVKRDEEPDVLVGTTSVPCFDAAAFDSLIEENSGLEFIVNVAKESYISRSGYRKSFDNKVPIGSMAELYRALRETDIRAYVDKEFQFVERSLSQHTRVSKFERLDGRRYLLERKGLPDVIVLFLNEYELTADIVRTARDRYGEFTTIARTNPNGGPTKKAYEVAKLIGCEIEPSWSSFLGALNR